MQAAMQNALLHNFHAAFLGPMEPVLPVLVLNVNRNNIVQDTINQASSRVEIVKLKESRLIAYS